MKEMWKRAVFTLYHLLLMHMYFMLHRGERERERGGGYICDCECAQPLYCTIVLRYCDDHWCSFSNHYTLVCAGCVSMNMCKYVIEMCNSQWLTLTCCKKSQFADTVLWYVLPQCPSTYSWHRIERRRVNGKVQPLVASGHNKRYICWKISVYWGSLQSDIATPPLVHGEGVLTIYSGFLIPENLH